MPHITIRDLDELQQLAEGLAAGLSRPPRAAMLLTGELGAGKTALVQRVFACLGASETVTSPTYERIHEHQLTTVGKLGIHVDAYEIDRFRVEELEEVWQLPNTIVCVEWADKLPEGSIPGDRPVWRLDLELGPDGTRACSYS